MGYPLVSSSSSLLTRIHPGSSPEQGPRTAGRGGEAYASAGEHVEPMRVPTKKSAMGAGEAGGWSRGRRRRVARGGEDDVWEVGLRVGGWNRGSR
jgi:hypothetical protein